MVARRQAASALGLSLAVAVLSGCGSEPNSPTVHAQLELSPAIPTVGVLTWEADVAIDSATVEFGRSPGQYEHTAPVDVADPDQPVLLLGMKADTVYYARVVADHGGETLSSDELSVTTGAVPNDLPRIEVNDRRRDDVYGGFSISCNLVVEGGYAFIYDADGDYVWWHALLDTSVEGCSRARLSFDGKYVWIGNLNNFGSEGALLRVTVDGMHSESYSLPRRHHDFAVLPNDHILYFERKSGGDAEDGSEGPDVIKELDPETGDSEELYDQSTDFADAESGAHTNYIAYVPELEAISFSMRSLSTIGVISYPNPELMLVFGGSESDFDISWNVQHGHQLTHDSLLLFNNEADASSSTPGASAALEFRYDAEAGEAEKVFEYAPGNTSFVMGDVQRLPNGNELVTFSTQGVIHEIDSDGELLREISTDPVGYVQQQKSLYGPPPPFLTE